MANKKTSKWNDPQPLIETKRKEFIDKETGEKIYVDCLYKTNRGKMDFWKFYMLDWLRYIGIIEHKQIEIFTYIIENTIPNDNLFIGTYKKIEQDMCCSSSTVAKTMKKLQDCNLIKKVQNGVWAINPKIMEDNEGTKQILLCYEKFDKT